MEELEKIKALLMRKRRWTWLLVLALLLLAIVFKRYELTWGGVAQAGVRLTQSIQHTLERQQPGEVFGRYMTVISGHCSYDPKCGPHDPFSLALGVIKATPVVSAEIWRTGNWFSRLVLIVTLGLELGFIYGAATDKSQGLWSRIVLAVFMIVWIPLLVSLIFWIILHFLIVLTAVIGSVLAGVVAVITACSGFWEIGKHLLNAMKTADKAEDAGAPFLKKVFAPKAAIGAPPAAPSSAPSPTASPPPADPPASGA